MPLLLVSITDHVNVDNALIRVAIRRLCPDSRHVTLLPEPAQEHKHGISCHCCIHLVDVVDHHRLVLLLSTSNRGPVDREPYDVTRHNGDGGLLFRHQHRAPRSLLPSVSRHKRPSGQCNPTTLANKCDLKTPQLFRLFMLFDRRWTRMIVPGALYLSYAGTWT
jgi:hypothetical protein